ncbi:MAG: FecR domain-containing protein [Gammaproteobacteria bacterium]|nr:FecR domain-containing protein [Gammaproteobacteria bacterium]
MSSIHEFPDKDRVHSEAGEWLAKLDRGLAADEQASLQKWLFESEQNRDILFNMAELWDKMDSLSRLSDLFPDVSRPRQPAWRYALAATLALVVTGLVFMQFSDRTGPVAPSSFEVATENPQPKNFAGIYETAVGEYSSVNLPDGTAVILNTNSLIRADYSVTERYVLLARGEAHFKVAEDPSRPLTVQAGNRLIRAVGTAFNVEIGRDNVVEIIVTEGRIAIIEEPQTEHDSTPRNVIDLAQKAPLLTQGEAAVLDATKAQIRKVAPEEVAVDLSWREGNLIFQGETLEEAIHEISRYTAVEFEILDERIRTVRVAGLFKAGDINGLLLTLRENFHIPSQRVGTERVLLGTR